LASLALGAGDGRRRWGSNSQWRCAVPRDRAGPALEPVCCSSRPVLGRPACFFLASPKRTATHAPECARGGGGRLGALSIRESPLVSRTRSSGYRGCCSPMRISRDAVIANAIWSSERRIYGAPLGQRKRARWRSRDEANVALGTVVKLKTAITRLVTTSTCAEPHGLYQQIA
jgi:hypothetical protein